MGVVTRRQLVALGFTPREIDRQAAQSQLIRLHRGVYSVGHADLSPAARLKAALLAFPADAFLSHRTAAAVHHLRPHNLRQIELTVIADSAAKRQGPLVVHRTTAPPNRGEVRDRFGLRYSSVPRLLLELATRETPDELVRLVTTSIRQGTLDLDALRRTIARHDRRPGAGRLGAVLERYVDTSDRTSGLERSFDRHARNDPRIPPYETNVRIGPYEFDCHWVALHTLLELDGRPYHRAIVDRENDDAKTNWAQAHGLSLCRISDLRWELDRAGAVEDLLALLAVGARRAA